jgi:hypothetical protein
MMLAMILRLGFSLELDESVLAAITLLLMAGTSVLWVRAYARSRRPGWLLMSAGALAFAGGSWVAPSFLWSALGGFLIFAGSLVLCMDLRGKGPTKG